MHMRFIPIRIREDKEADFDGMLLGEFNCHCMPLRIHQRLSVSPKCSIRLNMQATDYYSQSLHV